MSLKEALLKRRSIYALNKDLPVSEDEIIKTVEETVALIPDAFDCKSQRVIVVFGDKQDELWDAIFEAFNGQIAKEKTDFPAGGHPGASSPSPCPLSFLVLLLP